MARWTNRWTVLGLLLVACSSGQSGTEGADPGPIVGDQNPDDGGPGGSSSIDAAAAERRAEDCICQSFQGWTALEATVTAFPGGRVELEIDEVMGGGFCPPSSGGDEDAGASDCPLSSGGVVGGSWRGTLPCGDSCIELAVGDRVLALYTRGDLDGLGCPEYQQCSQSMCGTLDPEADLDAAASWDLCDMQCLEDTRDACAQHGEQAWLEGRLELAPLSEPLRLSDDFSYGGSVELLLGGPDEDCAMQVAPLAGSGSTSPSDAGTADTASAAPPGAQTDAPAAVPEPVPPPGQCPVGP
ncbi:MAG: hypothetical protein OEZ06_12965 [Myxococcales bacterium]|nr:hypothetical protein [Myxococcales bacterium]